jgi:DNA-directed RNA polymerase specialized sigma24 family protein
MLKGYVRRLARDRDGAADLLQETCLRVLVSETAPNEPSLFPLWCCGVARNVAAQQRRRQLRSDREAAHNTETLAGHAAQASSEHSVYVMECLAQLTDNVDADSLELFVRHYVFEERICDLAAERAQSAASLRMRLMRIRAAMRGIQG